MCWLFHVCCSCGILTHYCNTTGPLCMCDAMSMSTMKNDASKCVTVASCVVFWCNDEQLLAHLYYSFSAYSLSTILFCKDKKKLICAYHFFYAHVKKSCTISNTKAFWCNVFHCWHQHCATHSMRHWNCVLAL